MAFLFTDDSGGVSNMERSGVIYEIHDDRSKRMKIIDKDVFAPLLASPVRKARCVAVTGAD